MCLMVMADCEQQELVHLVLPEESGRLCDQ